MFSRLFFGTLLGALTVPSPAFCAMGPGSSGGGDEIAAEFVSLANKMIDAAAFDQSELSIIKNALATAKIESRTILMDPTTLSPVPNQEALVAWSTAGHIQIQQHNFQALINDKKPIAQYLFHELYRASGTVDSSGRSPDDSFQISIGKDHLDQLPLLTMKNLAYESCFVRYSGKSDLAPKLIPNTQGIAKPASGILNIDIDLVQYTVFIYKNQAGLSAMTTLVNKITGTKTRSYFDLGGHDLRMTMVLSQTQPFTTIDGDAVDTLVLNCEPRY